MCLAMNIQQQINTSNISSCSCKPNRLSRGIYISEQIPLYIWPI